MYTRTRTHVLSIARRRIPSFFLAVFETPLCVGAFSKEVSLLSLKYWALKKASVRCRKSGVRIEIKSTKILFHATYTQESVLE